MPPQLLVPPLGEQVQVQLTHGGDEPVGILHPDGGTVGVGGLERIGRGDRGGGAGQHGGGAGQHGGGAGQHGGEQPAVVQLVHRMPFPAGQQVDRHRVGPPGPDHEPVLPGGVRRPVDAEEAVRVVVESGGQALDLVGVRG